MNNRARNTVLAAAVMTILSINCFKAIPIYIVPLMEKLHVGIGQVLLLFTFSGFGSLITSLFIGQFMNKLGAKVTATVGGVLLGGFFIVLGFINNITAFYAASVVFGVSTIFVGFPTVQTQINWWYQKNTGKLMGTASTAVSVSGVVFPILIAKSLESFGVYITAVGQGIVVGVAIVLLSIFVLSEKPEQYGLKPVGYEENKEEKNAKEQPEAKFTVKQIIGMPQFWIIIISIVLLSVASTGFTGNASVLYQSKGITPINAALLISIMNGANLVVAPVYGALMDKMGYLKATIIFGCVLAGTFIASTAINGFVFGVIIAALMSFRSMNSMMGPITLPKLFGRKEAASLVGFTTAAQSIGAMSGAPIAGFMFDATGSYNTFMIISGVMILLAVLLVVVGSGDKAVASLKKRQESLI